MNRQRLIIGLTATAMSLGLAIGPALAAAKIEKRNFNTGAGSTNTNKTELSHRERNIQRNRASARNRIEVDEDTGNNKVEKNTEAGELTSGDAEVTGDITNDLNPSSTENELVVTELPDLDVDLENEKTGADSTNRNEVTVNSRRTTRLVNRATVRNNLDLNLETGDNQQKENTEAGDLTSGDAIVNLTIENTLN